MFQQLFDCGPFTNNEMPVAPFDQPRAPDQQAIINAGLP
jgi:hypothetical protein